MYREVTVLAEGNKIDKYTFAVTVNDQPGVLVRVAGLISRFKLNIDSMTVEAAGELGQSHMTVTLMCDTDTSNRINLQLCKLIDVIDVKKSSML